MEAVATVIWWLGQLFTWIVIASAVLSFFLAPYHPIRQALDRLVDPLLQPIRRVLPPVGGLDFSPVVLLVLVQVVVRLVVSILLAAS